MEQWKRVVINGIEYDYEVSTEGRVRNMKKAKRILKQHENRTGYLFVNLHKNKKQKNFQVHRLVAIMFIPNTQNKPTVNHIDENKHNNRVENLEWSTMKEQNVHGTRTERTQRKVKCIETGKIFDGVRQASRETGCHGSSIVNACKGKYKTSGGLHWEYV